MAPDIDKPIRSISPAIERMYGKYSVHVAQDVEILRNMQQFRIICQNLGFAFVLFGGYASGFCHSPNLCDLDYDKVIVLQFSILRCPDCPLCQIAFDLVLDQHKYELFLRHIVALQIVLDLPKQFFQKLECYCSGVAHVLILLL